MSLCKLSWDDFYMGQAFWVLSRSPDIRTNHGAILVSDDYEPISQGYNGYPAGCVDDCMPKEPPKKYLVTLHAEQNAILFSNKSLVGARLYVTGMPCSRCWAMIIQKKISYVTYGPLSSHCIDKDDEDARLAMLSDSGIIIKKYKGDIIKFAEQWVDKLKERIGKIE